jgi:ornithine cyclodeaminase/alanine dehydrogenase-like protein (mu-crystallin family)
MTVPHLDAGRIYRLAPFEELVTELRKAFANGPPQAIPPEVAPATGHGSYVLLGADGATVATLDGAALAARRTPAVSALATDALARDDVRRLAVVGTDVQAREHVRAMRWVRPSLEQIEIVGQEPLATERFVAMLRGEGHPTVVASGADVWSADLLCMCTWQPVPLFGLSAGAHFNAVGCGELPKGRVVDDLAALARGEVRRETSDEITIFVPTGLAVEDLVVATLAARNAGLID